MKRSFTLLQLLFAIWIAAFAAVLVNKLHEQGTCGKNTTRATLVSVAQQIEIFRLDHDRYPNGLGELVAERIYLREEPVDRWGNKLLYRRINSATKPFVLMSLGADGQEGGSGADRDVAY